MRKSRNPALLAVLNVGLYVGALLSVLPLIWLVCATFKTGEDLFNYNFLPWDHLKTLTLQNYHKLWTEVAFGRWLVNSIFLACMQTVVLVTLSSLGGFALAKYQFVGQKFLMVVMLATLILPGQVLMAGSYELMHRIGWVNSYWGLIIPGAVSVFGMFLFRQAMTGVPDELLQAGRLDGCSELRLWWEIALPIVRPMLGAYTLMCFIGSWNSFLWPQIMLQDEGKYTLPIGLANMMSLPEFQTDYGVLMAGTLLCILPIAILFFALQKDFVAGLAAGAVKG